MIADTVAKNICALRRQRNLTQTELSEYIHYSDKVISKWERGESVPDIEALAVLADFYKVSIDSLTKNSGSIRQAVAEKSMLKDDSDTLTQSNAEGTQSDKTTVEAAQQAKPIKELRETTQTQIQGDKAEREILQAQSNAGKAEWEALQKIKQKKLISRGARIASLVLLPLIMNVLYLIQNELFDSGFLTARFYFLLVIPAVLLANFIISLIMRRTFDSTEVIFLFFATVWTIGVVIIYVLWDKSVVAADSQKMRIWYVLLFYNIVVALSLILTGMGIKRYTRKRKEKNPTN